jgi:DNA-directed RNA polymerase specialized sigma subunit
MDFTVRPSEQRLIEEFLEVTQTYDERVKEFDKANEHLLRRRREIAKLLIDNEGAIRPRTHRQVGSMLNISGSRVGQLAQEARSNDSSTGTGWPQTA